jgi:hypothetical protein
MKIRFAFPQLAAATAFLAIVSVQDMQAQQTALPNNTMHAVASPAAVTAAHPVAPQPSAEEESAPTPGNSHGDGIKIHGHWLLQVKNPDGKIVDRREFNNSLVTQPTCNGTQDYCRYLAGDQLIAAILSGDLTPGGFGVGLITGATTGQDPTSFCVLNQTQLPVEASGTKCATLLDASTVLTGWPSSNPLANLPGGWTGGYQTGLTTSVTFSPQVNIVLSGNFTVGCTISGSGTQNCGGTMNPITAVVAMMAGCGNSTNVFGNDYHDESTSQTYPNSAFTGANKPGLQSGVASTACTATGQNNPTNPATVVMGTLTSTNVPNGPLTVATGQIITVVVTLSFS